MSHYFHTFVNKCLTTISIPSSRENIKKLRKINKELENGLETDASNIALDFNNTFGYLNSAFQKEKDSKALEGCAR